MAKWYTITLSKVYSYGFLRLTMKEQMQKILQRTRSTYRTLPDKKQYIEFFTALLSVPVLLTVILLNVNNLRSNAKPAAIPTAPTPVKEIIYVSPQNTTSVATTKNSGSTSTNPILITTTAPTPTTSPVCDKSIGQVDIKTPAENETISDNPVSVIIAYTQGNHCAVVWAYRINSGKWSEYDDKSIALYNLSNGSITLDLKVKSIVTGEEAIITRKFSYTGAGTPSTTPTASSSAN